METAISIFSNYSKIFSGSISYPIGQIVVILTLCTLCLLFGKYKTGFLLAYCNIIYVFFIQHRTQLIELFGGDVPGMVGYVMTMLILSIIAFVSLLQDNYR